MEQLKKNLGGEDVYQKRLKETGLSAASVRRILSRILFYSRYLDYKFRTAAQIDSAAEEKYYNTEFTEQMKARGEKLPPLDSVRPAIHELLVQQDISKRAAEWLTESRSRLKVEMVPAPGSTAPGNRTSGEAVGKRMTEKQKPNPAPEPKAKRKRIWPRRIAKTLVSLAFVLVLAIVALVIALAIGWFDAPMRNSVVGQIERVTGGRVELTHFHFAPFSLRVELQGLTVHGLEPDGTPPLFHTDYMVASIQVDSFWHRKVSLKDLRILKPEVHVRFNADGTSNVPPPRTPQTNNKPFRVRLFEFAIRHLELDDGTLLYNDVRMPLVAEGDNFNFAMDWGSANGTPIYLGQLSWKQFTFAARRYLPTKTDLSMKFTFAAESFHVEQLQLKLPHSSVDAQIDVEQLAVAEREIPLSRLARLAGHQRNFAQAECSRRPRGIFRRGKRCERRVESQRTLRGARSGFAVPVVPQFRNFQPRNVSDCERQTGCS